MSFAIEEETRKILDTILPDLEFNEVLNVKNSIRKSLANDFRAASNTPVSLVADTITAFLLRHSFATNLCGDALINSKGMALKNARSLFGFQKMIKRQHTYIVIDDDKFNNIICETIIQHVHADAKIETFTDPNIGLRHMHAAYNTSDAADAILLLDINMPTLLGWEVLDEIKNFPEEVKSRFKIFMLTSSLNPDDKQRAISNPLLWGYIEKPLTEERVKSLLFQEDPFSRNSRAY
jgi:CheY-like chemotaxis protein